MRLKLYKLEPLAEQFGKRMLRCGWPHLEGEEYSKEPVYLLIHLLINQNQVHLRSHI